MTSALVRGSSDSCRRIPEPAEPISAAWSAFAEESIHAWKQHADHIMAQELGRARWYARYRVEVARIERSYRSPGG